MERLSDSYAKRRSEVLRRMAAESESAVLVLPSAPVFVRNNDVDHDYRQDSDFFYLSAFDEPESVLVLTVPENELTLFVRPRDPERETWDGPRAGLEGAKAFFGADHAKLSSTFDEELPRLLENRKRVYCAVGRDRAFDDRVFAALHKVRLRARRGVGAPDEIVAPSRLLHAMRLVKDDDELALMRKAAAITGEAHLRAMAFTRPGHREFEIEAVLLEAFRRNGADRAAYQSIVGSGPNATILHYRAGHRAVEAGELVLIDAGCEYGYYACDVTRTFPASGTFTREQQAVYEVVLEAQLASVAKVVVGATQEDVHDATVRTLAAGLVRIGLLTGSVDEVLAKETYKRFYMHRTGHWLGMDVHDVGTYFQSGKARGFEPGFVTTVEPGLYIAKDDPTVGAAWRGIGVRIEDDILVTPAGPVNLTAHVPKTVDDVLRAVAR